MEIPKVLTGARPIYKKLLIIAIIAYIISSTILFTDLCYRLGQAEHRLMHLDHGHQDECMSKII